MTGHSIAPMFVWGAAAIMCYRERLWSKDYVLNSWLTVFALIIACAMESK